MDDPQLVAQGLLKFSIRVRMRRGGGFFRREIFKRLTEIISKSLVIEFVLLLSRDKELVLEYF